jgi:dTDP-4-dehydrorhamnose 3,5-epimerase
MHLTELPLAGAHMIQLAPVVDDRGHFVRTFCAGTMAAAGLEHRFVQGNASHSRQRATLRGLHYQLPPHAEVKLIRCVAGAIHDVIVDIRPQSPTFLQSHAVRLASDAPDMLYVPKGFAHGFITLSDDVEVHYMVSARYDPASERGLRHDDPALAIAWPMPVEHISAKDAAWPDYNSEFHNVDAFHAMASNR